MILILFCVAWLVVAAIVSLCGYTLWAKPKVFDFSKCTCRWCEWQRTGLNWDDVDWDFTNRWDLSKGK
jgi:hypothetical protein